VVRGARPAARKLALLAVILGIAGGLAFGIIGCVQGVGDADKYGRIDLPGEGVVDLPEGEVALYYEERVTLPDNDSLDSPDGIRVVAVRENERIRSEKRGLNNAISLDGRALDEWGKLEIPRAGKWRVVSRSRERGSNTPAVTFGVSQTDNFVNAALTFAGFAGGGLLLAGLILLFGRIGYEPLTPQQLAAQLPRRDPGPMGGAGGPAPWGPPPGTPGYGQQQAAPPPTPPPVPASPSPAPAPPVQATGGDPVEVQLRDLERRHKAGEIDGDEYQRQRRAVLDAAFGPPGG
jgi:hypothetical protein